MDSRTKEVGAVADPSFLCAPCSFFTPRGDMGSEVAPSTHGTPGGTSTISGAGCRGPDAHAENRRLQREIEIMREQLRAMGMCYGPSPNVGGPHPTPQEQSAVVSAAPSPSKPAHSFRPVSEKQGKLVARCGPLNFGNEAGEDTAEPIASKLRPLPVKSSNSAGKENSHKPAGMEPLVAEFTAERAAVPLASPKVNSGVVKTGKFSAGPSLFAILRTAAVVKAAERADGGMATGAAQVYQAAAAVMNTQPATETVAGTESASHMPSRNLQEEREKLKKKVIAFEILSRLEFFHCA